MALLAYSQRNRLTGSKARRTTGLGRSLRQCAGFGLQHHCRRHATRDKEDADEEEHDGNHLTAVFLQETDDRIEDAVEISWRHGINGEWPPTPA